MTTAEAVTFVNRQVRPRLRFLNDVTVGDWTRVLQRTDGETALRVVRQLIEDPSAKLGIKEFVQRLPRAVRQGRHSPTIESFQGYVRCLTAPPEHPAWEDREWILCLPTCFATNQRAAQEWLQARAGEIEEREGGRWCGVLAYGLRDDDGTGPEARHGAESRILDGPDTPGRRFLLRRCEQKTASSKGPAS